MLQYVHHLVTTCDSKLRKAGISYGFRWLFSVGSSPQATPFTLSHCVHIVIWHIAFVKNLSTNLLSARVQNTLLPVLALNIGIGQEFCTAVQLWYSGKHDFALLRLLRFVSMFSFHSCVVTSVGTLTAKEAEIDKKDCCGNPMYQSIFSLFLIFYEIMSVREGCNWTCFNSVFKLSRIHRYVEWKVQMYIVTLVSVIMSMWTCVRRVWVDICPCVWKCKDPRWVFFLSWESLRYTLPCALLVFMYVFLYEFICTCA